MGVTDEIKNRLDIVEVISDYMPLRKSGSSYSGFCPFHPNTRTPAFAVFPNSQTWRCFGACAEGGDVFSFVMKKEGWEFREALTHLADRAGVALSEQSPAQKAEEAVEDRLTGLLSAASDYFHQLLLHAPQAESARDYVAGRALQDKTVAAFKVGYSLDSWDACRKHFNMQGYDDDDLIDAGLLTVNEEKGTRYDRFRNRLMIPIYDVSGRPVGFGARTLDPEGLPKYLNSPQTTLFDKSRLLFGLDLAKRHIREARQVVIVEGYMDVMQAWQAGFRNVVAQMGTALTEEQLRLAKRYTKRFVLALDADAAGAKATMRSLEVAREVLDREPDARFNARGLVRHEGRLQAEIQIVSLPEGNDPDKIIRKDPSSWPVLVSEAKPVVAYVIGVATETLDMEDAKAKTAAIQQVLPLINDVVDPIEREHYRQLLARRLHIDERVLLKVAANPARRPKRSGAATTGGVEEQRVLSSAGTAGLTAAIKGNETGDLRRSNFLRQCMGYPRIVAQIDKNLAMNQQPMVNEQDFPKVEDRTVWQFLQERAKEWLIADEEELWDSLTDDFLRERLQTLSVLPLSPESELERLPFLLVLSVLDWRLEQIKALIGEIKQILNETQTQKNPELLEMYSQQLRDLPPQLLSIYKARGAMTAIGRRDGSI